jgi:hypothetical protein
MKRRDAVAASLGGLVLPSLAAPAAGQSASAAGGTPQILEWRRYQLRFGPMGARLAEYQKSVLLPALNRAGVGPVGVFNVQVGPDIPAVYMLLPHPNAESVLALSGRLAQDADYQRDATSLRNLPASDPPYVRRAGSLLTAFASTPKVEVPAGPLAAPSRIFELRTYESHSEAASRKKIEMFEQGGEIAIFRRVGLNPVFFGRDLLGPSLPSLTYMVVFADAAAREKAWTTFGADPDWVKLRAVPAYANAEILTNITSQVLRPADFSQI